MAHYDQEQAESNIVSMKAKLVNIQEQIIHRAKMKEAECDRIALDIRIIREQHGECTPDIATLEYVNSSLEQFKIYRKQANAQRLNVRKISGALGRLDGWYEQRALTDALGEMCTTMNISKRDTDELGRTMDMMNEIQDDMQDDQSLTDNLVLPTDDESGDTGLERVWKEVDRIFLPTKVDPIIHLPTTQSMCAHDEHGGMGMLAEQPVIQNTTNGSNSNKNPFHTSPFRQFPAYVASRMSSRNAYSRIEVNETIEEGDDFQEQSLEAAVC